ncbi:MAG: sulfotransferase family protein [Egibacteraceae bacterium]
MSLGRRVNAGVVFIGGAWHSGSTLLGLMLGAHSLIFFAGETKKSRFLGDPSTPLKMRVCMLCGPGCTVWGDLRVTSGECLYEMLSRRTNRPIVVDSSKKGFWIERQVAALRDVVPLHLVVLVRDGRAVVNSRLRKFPETSAADHAATWVARMGATEELASHFPGSVHRVRYEELALWPEPTLRALAGFLGVAFDPAMLDPWDSEPHPLGGNNGTLFHLARERASSESAGVVKLSGKTRDWYAAHPRGIVLDLRWRHELNADALAAFEAVAGETNRAYAWEEAIR